MARVAGKDGADPHFRNARLNNFVCNVFSDHFIFADDHFTGFRMAHRFVRIAADKPFFQLDDDLGAIRQCACQNAAVGAAILFADDDILRHIDETSRQISRVGRFERRIRQPFSGAVRRDKVLQYCQPFAERRFDRQFDDPAGRVGH